jgi:hypothetical protein
VVQKRVEHFTGCSMLALSLAERDPGRRKPARRSTA